MAHNDLRAGHSFTELERQRLLLEENVAKLRKSLQYWRTWEAEYEGMKEEVIGLRKQHTNAELAQAGKQCEGDLLNEKEIKLLLIDDKGQRRDSRQVIGLLSRRLEYVEQNVKTVGSLLATGEENLEASLAKSQSGSQSEEILPLTEIREELDEGGNVISSSTSTPRDAAPQVVEALRKAGIKDLPEAREQISKPALDLGDTIETSLMADNYTVDSVTSIMKLPKISNSIKSISVPEESITKTKAGTSLSRRKSVTFAEGTKTEDSFVPKSPQAGNRHAVKLNRERKRLKELTNIVPRHRDIDLAAEEQSTELRKPKDSRTSGNVECSRQDMPFQHPQDSAKGNAHDMKKIGEGNLAKASVDDWSAEVEKCAVLDEHSSDDVVLPSLLAINNEGAELIPELGPPTVPSDESPEDAALRQQMLQYGMDEVGAVVAEIDLYDDQSDGSSSDEEDEGEIDSSGTEEDEDRFGRSTRRVLDDNYLREMQALEKKLRATAIQNVGPSPNGVVLPSEKNEDLDSASSESPGSVPRKALKTSAVKGVRFSDELEVQDAPLRGVNGGGESATSGLVQHSVVERAVPGGEPAQPIAAPKKKVSRFKSARTSESTTTPKINQTSMSFPSDNPEPPVADTIIERPLFHRQSIPKPATIPTAFASEIRSRQSPSGPPNLTHAPTVIERPYSSTADPNTAVEPDELDPALLHQQVAMEYHRMRNRMIQRQGGFGAEEEEKAEVPLEEKEGGPPKMSRFKTARLATLG